MADINQVLHEKVMGECWHEGLTWDEQGYATCGKCDRSERNWGALNHPHYHDDPLAYWRLLQKVNGYDRNILLNFLMQLAPVDATFPREMIFKFFLDQQRGCKAIADFFVPGWRE